MPENAPAPKRGASRAQVAAIFVGLAAVASAATWWLGPWSRSFRYGRTTLVSLRRIVDNDPKDFLAWREMGLRLAREGDGTLARPALEQAFDLDPTDPEVATGLGEIHFMGRRYGEAFQVLTAAVRHNPGYPLAHMALGRVYKKKASYHRAISEFDAVTKADPEFSDAFYEIATCYLKVQQVQKAHDAIGAALRISPDEPQYLTVKSVIDATSGRTDSAIDSAAKAAKLAPKDVSVQVSYCNLLLAHYRGRQDVDQALQVMKRIEALSPRCAVLPFLRGQIDRLQGKWASAAGHLEQAARSTPGEDEVYYALGQVYRRLGRNQEADRVLGVYRVRQKLQQELNSVAIRLGGGESKDVRLHARLVEVHMKLGDAQAARDSLETAMQIDPSAPVLKRWIALLHPSGPPAGGPVP